MTAPEHHELPRRGSWGRRLVIGAVAVVVAAMAVTAGVLVVAHEPGDGPVTAAPESSDDGTECGIEPMPDGYMGAPPTSAAVIALASGASFWNPEARGQNLSLVAYADGTVVVTSDAGGYEPVLPTPMVGWVGPCAVADARDRLVRASTSDFGLPGVTDSSTALLMVDPFDDQKRSTVEIYALDRDPDLSADADAVAARRTVRAVLGELRDTATANSSPLFERRYRLQRYEGVSTSTDPAVVPWPLPTPIDQLVGPERCAEINSSVVDTLWTARPDGRPVGQWADATTTAVLAISVLMPGEPACPPRPTPWR